MCRCASDLCRLFDALTLYVSTHMLCVFIYMCVLVIHLPTALCRAKSLVPFTDVWFVYVSVFMHKCSMCANLCLNPQLLRVPR